MFNTIYNVSIQCSIQCLIQLFLYSFYDTKRLIICINVALISAIASLNFFRIQVSEINFITFTQMSFQFDSLNS